MRTWFAAAIVLLSGCVVAETDSSPRVVSAHGSGPGLEMNATVTSEEDQHRLEAHVRNVGRSTYNVSAICAPVFSHEIRKDDVRVWPEPEVTCMAYGVKPFPPGAAESFAITWDERNADGGRVAAGDYVWSVAFRYQEDDSSGWKDLTVDVPVRVR